WLEVGRRDGTSQLIETATGKEVWRKERPQGPSIFSQDGKWLAFFTGQPRRNDSASEQVGIEIWEKMSGQVVLRLPAPRVPQPPGLEPSSTRLQPSRLFFSQNGRTLVIGADDTVQVWRLDGNP